MSLDIYRVAQDRLSRQRWSFYIGAQITHAVLRLAFYGVERRRRPVGVYSKAGVDDRWDSRDERRYYSGLKRPDSVPQDVLDEARSRLASEAVFIVRGDEL